MSRRGDQGRTRDWIEEIAFALGTLARGAGQAVRSPYRATRDLVRKNTGSSSPKATRRHSRRDGRDRVWARRRPTRPEAETAATGNASAGLAGALRDPDPAVRALAAETIGAFSPEKASDLLSGLLHDPDPGVRVAAIDAAVGARATGVVFAIILALEDVDADVRAGAASAIAALTGKTVDVDLPDEARRAQISELKKWWKEQRLAQLAGGDTGSHAP